MKPTKIVALLLVLMAVFPLARIVFRWEITMNGSPVPMWISVAFLILFMGMAVILCREARKN